MKLQITQKLQQKFTVCKTHLQNSQENNCAGSFFNKSVGVKLATLLKRDSSTDVFMGIFRNFPENLFCMTSVNVL